jgi:hypothetical protein
MTISPVTGIQPIFIVECECRVAIPLPPQSPLGIFLPPRPRPNPDKWPANFVCTDCGRWFSRSAQEFHLEENASLVRSLDGETFWRVVFECERPDCGQCISAYLMLPPTRDAIGVAAIARASKAVECPVHGMILLPREPSYADSYPYLFRSTWA